MAKKWYAYLFKENIYGVGIQALTFIAGVLSTVIFPNLLGKDGFGYFSIVVGLVSIGALFCDFGMAGALLRFIPEGMKKGIAWKYYGRLLTWKVLTSAIAAAAAFLLADSIAGAYKLPGLADGIRLGAAFLLSYGMFQFFENTFIALKKTKITLLMDFIFHSGRVLLPLLLFLVVGMGYTAAVAGNVIASGAAVALAWFLVGREPILRRGAEGRADSRALNSYITFGTVAILAYALSQWSDILIVGLFRPVSEVSVYRVAWLWATATAFLFPFSQRIFFAAHAHEDEARSRVLFGLTLKYGFIFTFLMITGIILVSAQFLGLLYQGTYNDAYPVLVILSALTIDLTLSTLASTLLSGKGDIRTPTVINAVAGIAQVALLFAVVPTFGLLGAAMVVVLVRVSAALAMTISALRFMSVRIPPMQVLAPGLASVITIAALAPIRQFSFSLLGAFAYGCAVVAVYSLIAVILRAVDLKEITRIARNSVR